MVQVCSADSQVPVHREVRQKFSSQCGIQEVCLPRCVGHKVMVVFFLYRYLGAFVPPPQTANRSCLHFNQT